MVRSEARAPASEPRHAAAPPSGARAWVAENGQLVALLAVTVLYVVVQAVVFSWGEYYVNRDEAIFLTQVVPGEVAHDMAPHRTRGMSLLALPIAPWAHSMFVLRAYFVLLGAVGLFFAFRPWIRSVGWAAPAAAFVFASYWVNVMFGAQLYPNFFAALGAAGYFIAYLAEGRRGDLVAVAALVTITALVRPLDIALVAIALWVGMLLFKRRDFIPATVALAVGGLAGFAPWFAEGWARFDLLPWELLFAAEESGASGLEANNLAVYLNNTDGPYRCVDECPAEVLEDGITMRIRERLIVGGMLAASLVGLAGSPRRVRTQAMYISGLALVSLFAYYLTCDCAINLRYLEPASAFLSVLVGGGIVTGWALVSRLPWGMGNVLRALAVVLLAGWALYQTQVAARISDEGFASRERAYVLSQIIEDRVEGEGEPCAVASAVSDRQIQFYSPCIAVSLNRGEGATVLQNRIGGSTSVFDLNLLSDAGYRIFALGRPRHIPEGSPVWDWEAEDISSDVLGEYLLFEAPPGVELESNYRDDYSPEEAGPP